jgi:hypothetical protein
MTDRPTNRGSIHVWVGTRSIAPKITINGYKCVFGFVVSTKYRSQFSNSNNHVPGGRADVPFDSIQFCEMKLPRQVLKYLHGNIAHSINPGRERESENGKQSTPCTRGNWEGGQNGGREEQRGEGVAAE